MNKWECDAHGCTSTAIGCGGAIGLRALGWQFERGGLSDISLTHVGPIIRCPIHRTDGVPGDVAAKSTQALLKDAEHEV